MGGQPEYSGGLCLLLSGDCSRIDTPPTYGDSSTLDALWDACAAGDWAGCTDLYWGFSVLSGYEAFGASCGNRNVVSRGEREWDMG